MASPGQKQQGRSPRRDLDTKRKDRHLNFMTRYRLVFVFKCLISFTAFSQSELPVDTTSVNQLLKLSIKDQWIDPYRSLDYADQALKQAEEINYRKGVATAHNLKGFSYWTFGDNELAIQSAHDALEIAGTDNYKL